MPRSFIAVLVGGVVFCLVWLGGGSAASVAAQPSIRPASIDPLRVRGVHFETHERVRVIAVVGAERRSRTTNANDAGGFIVDLGRTYQSDRCNSSLFVRAVGSSGSRATFKLPLLECRPGLEP
jgi:hypothetical protein